MAWVLVLVPLAGGAAIGFGAFGRRPVVLGAAGVAVLGLTTAVGGWAAAAQPSARLAWGGGLALGAHVVGISRVMVVLVPGVALAVVAYTAAYMHDDPALPRLLGLLVAFVAAMEMLVVAADFVALLVGWELVSAFSWALISHDWRSDDAPRAAAQAFMVTRVGDLGLFLAAGAAFAARRSFAFSSLPGPSGASIDLVAAGVLVAAAAKSAQLPFSPWLFAAMGGPTPASALLHSATMVAAGGYLVARLGPALGTAGWFGPAVAGLGVATALAGGMVACVQTDLKKALAASTSAQYGLVLVAAGAGSAAAATGHLVTHAVFKSLLFLGAGVAIHAGGTGRLDRLGLGRAQRATAVLFGTGALALAAVPPLGGAATKEMILAAASGWSAWLGAGVLVAGLLSAFYAGRLQVLAFGPDSAQLHRRGVMARVDGRPGELWAMGLLATATVALSALWLTPGRRLLARVAGSPLAVGSGAEILASLATLATAAAAVWALHRAGRLATLGLRAPTQARLADWFALPLLGRTLVVDPVLALARLLAAVDDRVIDAGVGVVGAAADAVSNAFAGWAERGVDGLVWGVGAGALSAARGSRSADERGIDGAVEGMASGVGMAGRLSRRLQTGLSHHYFVIAAVGLVVVVVAAAVGRR
ncbi:MAG: NADH-quinone oxidoreductase subunit 5 family protein [Acidimicrobiales bacterium]